MLPFPKAFQRKPVLLAFWTLALLAPALPNHRLFGAGTGAGAWISPSDPRIQYAGRVVFGADGSTARFDWPGTQIRLLFQGSGLALRLRDGANDYDVWVDGKLDTVWATAAGQDLYRVRSRGNGAHWLRVVKRTEGLGATTVFQGLVLDPGARLLEPFPAPQRRIRFIGDSYTCGYGDEGPGIHCVSLRPYQNVEDAYGPQACRMLGADYQITAISGKGLLRNYGAPGTRSPDALPLHLDRTLRDDPRSAWNDSAWVPQGVVVFVGINDFSTEPHPSDRDFLDAYAALLAGVKQRDPGAKIFCVSCQDSPLLRPLLEQLAAKNPGLSLTLVDFDSPAMDERGCDWHPKAACQLRWAGVLAAAIREKLGWN